MINYEYKTTILEIKQSMIGKTIDIQPPGESYSLLGVTFSDSFALYTWAKQSKVEESKPVVSYSCTDEEFEKTLDMVKNAEFQKNENTKPAT